MGFPQDCTYARDLLQETAGFHRAANDMYNCTLESSPAPAQRSNYLRDCDDSYGNRRRHESSPQAQIVTSPSTLTTYTAKATSMSSDKEQLLAMGFEEARVECEFLQKCRNFNSRLM